MNARRLFIPTLVVFLTSALRAKPAQAQTTQGFAVERFEPSEQGSDWFAAESLDLRGKLRFGGGAVFDYAHDPLVLYKSDLGEDQSVEGGHFFAHVGASVVLENGFRLALSLPLALAHEGNGGVVGAPAGSSDNATTLGDLRLGADVRLFGQYRDPVTLGAGVQFFVPTGSRSSSISDESVRLIPHALVAGRIAPFVYSFGLGYQYRGSRDGFVDGKRGSEASLSAATGLRLVDDRLVVGPELFGSAKLASSDSFIAKHQAPFELLMGGHFSVAPEWKLGAGVGAGLTRAVGTPVERGVFSIEWLQELTEPLPRARDRDHDTISDSLDACPDTPGPKTRDSRTNGCPAPPDRAHDGVLDKTNACRDVDKSTVGTALSGCHDADEDSIVDRDDACPDTAGVKTSDPKTSGCPDRDGDNIIDDLDACPDEPGDASPNPKKNGCPPSNDQDGDGISDQQDVCPYAPGLPDPNPKKNGCPTARVERGQIRTLEQVQFAHNSAQILKASDAVLLAVAKILSEDPRIKTVRIEGHTDNKGADTFNLRLSQKRAESVMAWLARHGIDQSRMTAEGFGKERPIDSNDTDDGRASNRRIEFHVSGR